MHPARLFIVCGLPGAGTTTRATELTARFGAVRMCPDDWMEHLGVDLGDEALRARIERLQAEVTADLLRLGTNVVVDWGTWARRERDGLRAIAREIGALAHLEFLDPPLDVLWERVRSRGDDRPGGSRAITRADLERWSTTVERPAEEELAGYDPMPPVAAGSAPGTPAYPYGSWTPWTGPAPTG